MDEPCSKTVTLRTLDQSVPASFKISPTLCKHKAVSFLIPPGTMVPLIKGTWPETKTRLPKAVPPERVGPTVPRWVMSVLRAVRGVEEEVRGEALARATREVRREKLKSIVKVGWVVVLVVK